jgi:tetratricopeptide (TPR) repeat protein
MLQGASLADSFQEGTAAYRAGDYAAAAKAFRQSASQQPASGTLQNLGLAEWRLGRFGEAILAWDRALWLDPFNEAVRADLRFARKTAQLEAPDLTWYEVVSTWLPANSWAWIAGSSLWVAVGMVMLPGILRWRKAAWHQAAAALGLMVFLLSVPAYVGLESRSRIGFVLGKDTVLRLTPTREAQTVTRLAAGEPARLVRARGNYVLLRTNRALGWVERAQFGLTSS